MSKKIVLVFEGGTRGKAGTGFGSFAVIRDNQRTITRLEFGAEMTGREAEYDTLITALEMLIHEGGSGEIVLEVQSSSQLAIYQVKGIWRARDARMRARCERVRDLLRAFKTTHLLFVSQEQVASLFRS